MLTLGELVAFLDLDDSKFNSKIDAAEGRMGRVGSKMTGVGQKMSMGITLPALAIGGLAVNAAAKFGTSMNQVQAATGASGAELAKLSAYAKQMGAATVFSAGESADAMLELAKGGMTPAQIQGGALKATMDLAAAGGLELADAATTTTNAMNTFGLGAKDATSVAAALAGGANASSADVSDLSMALSQVGPGAKNAGMSLQETVAVLAAFSDKGIRGSDAGTSLKTMLTNLVPATDKAAKMQKSLGLSFVDSKGNIDDISTVAEKLKDKLGGLSEAQRMTALNVMFGSDATRAATVLMDDGAQGLVKYTDATNDQSAATDMAKARMKGLGGALENMKGSVETAGIAIGETLAPAINIAAGAIKWLADGFSGMPKALQGVAVGVGVLVAAMGPLLIVVGSVLQGFQRIRDFRFRGNVATSMGKGAATGAAGSAGVTELGSASGTAAIEVANLGRAAGMASGGKGSVALGNSSSTATSKIKKMGNKAEAVAPQLTMVEKTASRTGGRMGRLSSAIGSSTVGTIAATIGLGLALDFTIPKVLAAADAFGQWVSALGQARQAKSNREGEQSGFKEQVTQKYGSPKAYLAHLAQKFGKDSTEYKNALYSLGMAEPASAGATTAVRGAGVLRQATGGDYMVSRPTLFLAGEAGPERATFTPKGKGGAGHTFDFRGCSFNAQSPRELVEQVKSMIMDDVIPAMAGVNIG